MNDSHWPEPPGPDEIDHFAVGRLKEEIKQQCCFIQLGLEMAYNALSDDELWFCIQGVLAAAATISKVCWDDAKRKRDRVLMDERKEVRRVLEITRSSALFSRAVRNSFEHIDREYASWIAESENGSIMSIRSFPSPLFEGMEVAKFGQLDRGKQEVTFLGNVVNLEALGHEADRILLRAEEVGWGSV